MKEKLLRAAVPILCLGLVQCTSNDTSTDTPGTAFAVVRLTANGAADTTFGGGRGIVVTDIDPPAFDFAMAVAIQPTDNKIVVGGSDGLGGQGLTALVRYNADGTLDTTGFGTNGIVRTTLPSPASATALAIQGDGKIVAAALTFAPATSTTGITLIRYNANGTLDTAGFGTNGIAVPAPIGSGLAGDTCALLAQGAKFVVAGGSQNGNIVLYRYDSAGVLDPTFGALATPGKTTTSLGAATVAMSPAMAVQSDGRIILVTGNSSDQVVLRYSADGVLDTTFGGGVNGGIVTTDVGGSVNFANAVAVQPASMGDASNTDKIFVSGHALGNASDITLVRYTKDGLLDTTFNATGIVRTDLGATDNVFTVALQPQPAAAEPKILVSGNVGANGAAQTIVLRYNANGTPDTSFGNQGLLLVPLFGPSTIASGNAMVLQPVSAGLGIVVAGYD